jgi:transcriptional regulator GlxA family with amidase domain
VQPDILLVPGGPGDEGVIADAETLAWIAKVHETTKWTTSVCTGSIILAAAGLLKGLEVTTHWASASRLEEYGARYTEKRVVQHGKIMTGAGVSAGIDMGLTLAAAEAGEEFAKAIQLGIEYDPQPPFDSGAPSKATPELVQMLMAMMGDSRQGAAA